MSTKILIAEDDAYSLMLIRDVLTEKGYQVIEAANGKAAIELAQSEQPELILLDIRMPQQDGCEVMRALKNDRATARIKIIVLTSCVLRDEKREIVAAGCDRFMAKPFRIRELLAAIQELSESEGSDGE